MSPESINTGAGAASPASSSSTPQAALKVFTLKRIAMIQDGTFGVLLDEGIPFALTVERRWFNNKKGESCIPKGEYLCERVTSPKFGNTFEVRNVPGRDAILFHKGNVDEDSHGCVIVGERFDPIKGKTAVLASKEGFGEFLARLEGQNQFRIVIVEV